MLKNCRYNRKELAAGGISSAIWMTAEVKMQATEKLLAAAKHCQHRGSNSSRRRQRKGHISDVRGQSTS
jgi:hypothetical protein